MGSYFIWVVKIGISLLLLTAGGNHFNVLGQILPSGHASTAETGYGRDQISIFCGNNGFLTASFTEVPGNLQFVWEKYNVLTEQFDIAVKSEWGEVSSLNITGSGGYRVRILDGNGLDTLFYSWVFLNDPVVTINQSNINHTCEVLDLFADVDIEVFNYIDPLSGDNFSLSSGFDIAWVADPFIPLQANQSIRIWSPPSVRTTYSVHLSYNSCESEFSTTLDPLTSKAVFNFSPSEGESPLDVIFDASESLNAQRYEWFFQYHPDTTDIAFPDSFMDNPEHTYYVPGEYFIMLRTVSPFFCANLWMNPTPVRVHPSRLEVPNVFTPNNDGFNDYFIVDAASLKVFRGQIFNRQGIKVFDWSDPDTGWDGKINGDNPASPGAYFYIITGRGWDGVEYEYTGTVYLFR